MANTADDIFNAINAGDTGAVARLMETDSNLARARNELGVSALMQARYANQVDIVALLRNAAGELDIFEAAALGDVTRLQALLANGPEPVNSHSNDGFTPLHLACFFGQPSVAEALIAQGADVHARSRNPMQNTPLHAAAAGRSKEAVRALLEHGADVNARQDGGWTALHAASQNGDVEMVRLLIAGGADVQARAGNQQNAMDLALTKGHQAVVDVLDEYAR